MTDGSCRPCNEPNLYLDIVPSHVGKPVESIPMNWLNTNFDPYHRKYFVHLFATSSSVQQQKEKALKGILTVSWVI